MKKSFAKKTILVLLALSLISSGIFAEEKVLTWEDQKLEIEARKTARKAAREQAAKARLEAKLAKMTPEKRAEFEAKEAEKKAALDAKQADKERIATEKKAKEEEQKQKDIVKAKQKWIADQKAIFTRSNPTFTYENPFSQVGMDSNHWYNTNGTLNTENYYSAWGKEFLNPDGGINPIKLQNYIDAWARCCWVSPMPRPIPMARP